MKKVHGIFAPIVTAFDASGEAITRFCREYGVRRHVKLSGLGCAGQQRRATLLSHEEKVKLGDGEKPPARCRQNGDRRHRLRVLQGDLQLTKESAAVGADVGSPGW